MTNEEIIEGNKLIGEFLHPEMLNKERIEREGLEIGDNTFQKINVYLGQYDMMKYHSSWDWLMPVIKQIKKINPPEGWGYHNAICASLIEVDIITTYATVVKFIKWYNKYINE